MANGPVIGWSSSTGATSPCHAEGVPPTAWFAQTLRSSMGLSPGEVNALAAFLRGELSVEGDSEFLVLFQRVLPAPPAKVQE